MKELKIQNQGFGALAKPLLYQKEKRSIITESRSYPNHSSKLSKFNINRFESIEQVIRAGQLYLDPHLSLTSLSEVVKICEGYISQLINYFTEQNFTSYINSLRVEEAKRLLQDSNYDHFTMVAIGMESGFNSKSTFYAAFKKYTGISPTEYRNVYGL